MNSRRPRVLQLGKFYPPHMGGIETHLEALCSQLKERTDVRVVVASDRRRRRDEVRDGIGIARLATVCHFANTPICPGLVGEIRRAKPDLVHMHLPHPAAILALLASGYRGPLVVTYHSDVILQKRRAALFQPILDLVLRRCSTIVATSERYVETSPVLSVHRERCRVIPYGIGIERFTRRDEDAVASIRSRFGPRIVLAVGRLIYYKGFEYLIRAMQQIDARLLLVGEGPLRATLERAAQAAGLGDRVVFVGEAQPEDVVAHFKAADLFVLPSIERSEAFGIVQLEAMACGIPVVNTNLPSGVPTVSPHGLTGLTVPPREPAALAKAITQLLDDPDLRRRFGEAARRRVEAEFTLDLMGRRMLGLYDELLGLESAFGRAQRSPSYES